MLRCDVRACAPPKSSIFRSDSVIFRQGPSSEAFRASPVGVLYDFVYRN